MHVLLINLAFQDDIGCGSSESRRPTYAGSIADTQAHAFCQFFIFLFPFQSSLLHIQTPVTNAFRNRGGDTLCFGEKTQIQVSWMYQDFFVFRAFIVSVIVYVSNKKFAFGF